VSGEDVWVGGERGVARFDGRAFHAVNWQGRDTLTNVTGILEMADGGEVIIYAPHLENISATHGQLIEKYGYAPKPEDYEASGVQIFRPLTVFAWKQFPKDVTRWQFSESE